MLRACNAPDRYKRRRPTRAFAQRDPARIPAPPKIQLTKIKFDTDLTRGQTRERDEDSVLSRIASLRTNPLCRPIS